MAEQMWRVVAVYRVITLMYAAVLFAGNHGHYAHRALGLALLGIMTCWSALTTAAYTRPAGRTHWLVATDVAVAAALVLSTRWIETGAQISAGAPTLPVSWAAAPVLACAVVGGPWTGLAGALVISGADLGELQALPGQSTIKSIVLLLIAGGVGGYVVRLGLRAEDAVARASAREAALSERERIARGIHDSVLQVLALVSSRGQALGGEAARLGKLAAEQESALRALLTGGDADRDHGRGLVDAADLLQASAAALATVSRPVSPVLLPASAARALGGAVSEALGNVLRHAGPDSRAWILVEDEGSLVRVTVRDNGAGFADGRLTLAAGEGRLGVSHSIVGRMREAGGTATVTSFPGQGTEVELVLPRN